MVISLRFTELNEETILCASQSAESDVEVEIEPNELSKLMENVDDALLIDVREEYEREICCINGSEHIPLKILGSVADKLPSDKKIIF